MGIVSSVLGRLSMGRDFSRKKLLAAELLKQVYRNRPGGVDISRRDDAEGVAALMHLLEKNTDVVVVKNKKGAMLMLKHDADQIFDPSVHAAMDRNAIFALPKEDLFDE